MTILIPMAGLGSRFKDAGYDLPKPMIDVAGKPMIERVLDALPNVFSTYIFVVNKEHKKFGLNRLLKRLRPNSIVLETDGLTEGAASTCLLAKEFINNGDELFIVNCDQITHVNYHEFDKSAFFSDGVIITFESDSPKNSYLRVNERNEVVECREKEVISNIATTGMYWWRFGSEFVAAAEDMIRSNDRTNNEFYVCPVYNYMCKRSTIRYLPATSHYPIGTPEDLEKYIGILQAK